MTQRDGGGDLVAKLCLTLGTTWDGSPLGSSVREIFQARILEWGCHWYMYPNVH